MNDYDTYLLGGLFFPLLSFLLLTFLPLLLFSLTEGWLSPRRNVGHILNTYLFFLSFQLLPHLTFFDDPNKQEKLKRLESSAARMS